MINTVLFVHGTGVRHASYVETSSRVAAALDAMKLGLVLRPCSWGQEHGAELPPGAGLSIPDYEGPAEAAPLNEAQVSALWELLAHDPLFELRERAAMEPPDFISTEVKNQKIAYPLVVQALGAHSGLLAELKGKALSIQWPQAVETVSGAQPFADALTVAQKLDADLRIAVARAIVASLQQRLADANMPQLGRPLRDNLVDLCVNNTGGYGLGATDWLKKRFIGLGLRWATDTARRKRDALYNAAYPAAGDILLYQARGDKIRDFIAKRIAECEGEVAILAHSLGGIASVDLLVEQPQDKEKLLVTVGSQAPFLYEIDALTKLQRGKPLPEGFPKRWINFYDPDDLLSYRAAQLFKPIATDHKIVSGQPFPYSHSAYWDMPALWEKLKPALVA
jgi:hypothetical protein